MRAKVNGKWIKDTRKINDDTEYLVELPRRKEVIDGIEYDMFSKTVKMTGKYLKKYFKIK